VKKQRRFPGEAADIARDCLLRMLLPSFGRRSPVLALRRLWKKQNAAVLQRADVSADRVAAARNCPSSLLLSAAKSNSRFCHLSWFCPYCYSRAAAELWRDTRIRQNGFRVLSHFDDVTVGTLESRWFEMTRVRDSFSGSRISWQYVHPTENGLRIRLIVCLANGEDSMDDFTAAFAYQPGWLLSRPALAAVCVDFMRTRRGRFAAGFLKRGICQ